MIELLLEAERAMSVGMLDQAERIYRQAADADPRNSIAVVGLARIALERDDEEGALRLGERALAIDPENLAARRLVDRLVEVRAHRGVGGYVPPAAANAGSGGSGEAAVPAMERPRDEAPGVARPRRFRRWLRRG